MSYWRFGAMIATSTVAMFGLMYLNTYAWEHVFFSETRVYMAIVMGACMAVIMLSYMLGMYTNTKANVAIYVGSVAVFAVALWLVRSQATVGQVSYMRAMIPHHSIAIMTSERAEITDPRVRKLADEIIEAQRREISEMRYLIADLTEDGGAEPLRPAEETPEVASIAEALSATIIEELDPQPMTAEEVGEVLEPGPGCSFSRTAEADPVLVAVPSAGEGVSGVMKLNGKLVPLEGSAGTESLISGPTMVAEGVRMSVLPVSDSESGEDREADLVFELDERLTVGYRGFYRCNL